MGTSGHQSPQVTCAPCSHRSVHLSRAPWTRSPNIRVAGRVLAVRGAAVPRFLPAPSWGPAVVTRGRGLGQEPTTGTCGLSPYPRPDGAHWPPRLPAQTPLHGAGLPAPTPAWARMTHSACSVGRRPGGEREPAKHGAVCSQRGSRSHGGYWGCWAVPGRACPRTPGGLGAHSPPNPVMGAYCPTSSRLRLLERSFSPWTQLCVLRAPPCAGGPERLPELSLAGFDPSLLRTPPPAPCELGPQDVGRCPDPGS